MVRKIMFKRCLFLSNSTLCFQDVSAGFANKDAGLQLLVSQNSLKRSEVLFCHLHNSENSSEGVICCLSPTSDNERGRKESTTLCSDLVLSLKHCCCQSSSSDFKVNKFNTDITVKK